MPSTMPKIHLRGMTRADLSARLQSWHLPRYRVDQILDWIYRKKVRAFHRMRNLPGAVINRLREKTDLNRLKTESLIPSPDGESVKFLTLTQDRLLCESVLIVQANRRTLCLSTQLGCRMRCIFCASGKGRFGRNLTAGEIVEQVSVAETETGKPVANVVFMGMGEPLDNFDNVMKALTILRSPWGYGFSGRRITVSTSGITPKIESFVKETDGAVRLSVSLHSADDGTRSFLVPINKQYCLSELIKKLDEIHCKLKREITFEYTLIDGVNDSEAEAEATGRIASRLHAKVNLIPYNPIREMDFKTPSSGKIEIFRKALKCRGVHVTVRRTAGRAIDAACGQLRLDRIQ